MVRIDPVLIRGLIASGCCLLASCSEQPKALRNPGEARVPFTSVSTLQVELRTNRGPMLVEFAQDFNCARCDQMTSTMRDLRAGFSQDVTFHRVNYLAAGNEFPLGICPTYLFVLDGEIVGQAAGKQPYPVLAAGLDDLVAVHRQQTVEQVEFQEEKEDEINGT